MANKDNSRTGNQQGSQGGNKNPGNFANDREKASEAGRKGVAPWAADADFAERLWAMSEAMTGLSLN